MDKKSLLIYFSVFFLSLVVHLIGLNKIGRTWDEQFKVDYGIVGAENFLTGNFSESTWDHGAEHPMVGKYLYGLALWPEVIPVKLNPNGTVKVQISDVEKIQEGNYHITQLNQGIYLIPYDLTLPRVLSAVADSLAVVATVMIASFLIGNSLWVLLAGVFLVLTPRFVFLGQLVTFESLTVFFFCATVLVFFRLLGNPRKTKLHLLTGLLCGLLFWTRYNNIIIFPFLAGWLLIHFWFTKEKAVFSWRLVLIPLVAFLFGIAIWPLMWHQFPKHLLESFQFHEHRTIFSLYYWKYFLITTPIPTLVGFVIGLVACFFKRDYAKTLLLWWLACVVLIYSILTLPSNGTRYVSVLYPAIAILAAFGYSVILRGRRKFLLIPVIAFLIFEQASIFPYYLDYYNQFVGGTSGAVSRGYEFSWWGEGQAEVGRWMNDNVPQGSTVGLIVTPEYVFPETLKNIESKGYVDEKTDADFVVVSRDREETLSKEFFQNHELIYSAKAGGVSLVNLYRLTNL